VIYRIEVLPPARKEIESLPGHVRAQARQLIRELSADPRPTRAKELRGRPNIYRIWLVTRWRIVYEIRDEQLLVLLVRVRRKTDIDYESL